MSTCLVELVKPYIESIDIEEVARQLKVKVEDILGFEFWAFALWFRVSGRGAVLVSPRKLSFWIPAIKSAIASSQDSLSLEKLQTALEVEFQTRCDRTTQQQIYSNALQAELQQLVKRKFKQIEQETLTYRQAESLTESYKPIIKQCIDRESLDVVAQLIRKNYQIFEPFPYLLQQLRQVWANRRDEILGKGGLLDTLAFVHS